MPGGDASWQSLPIGGGGSQTALDRRSRPVSKAKTSPRPRSAASAKKASAAEAAAAAAPEPLLENDLTAQAFAAAAKATASQRKSSGRKTVNKGKPEAGGLQILPPSPTRKRGSPDDADTPPKDCNAHGSATLKRQRQCLPAGQVLPPCDIQQGQFNGVGMESHTEAPAGAPKAFDWVLPPSTWGGGVIELD